MHKKLKIGARASIACSLCRKRKARCSGEYPACAFCSLRNLTCEYDGHPEDRTQLPLPPTPILLACVDSFFEFFGDSFSFLHRSNLVTAITREEAPSEIIHCILAYAAKLPRHRGELESSGYYARTATQLLTGPAVESLPLLIQCQCYLFLGLYECTDGAENAGWLKLGTALRIAQLLRLSFEDEDEPRDPISAETRRRTFWACFLLERTLTDGKDRPCILSVPYPNALRLPGPDAAFEAGTRAVGVRFDPCPPTWALSASEVNRRSDVPVAATQRHAGSALSSTLPSGLALSTGTPLNDASVALTSSLRDFSPHVFPQGGGTDARAHPPTPHSHLASLAASPHSHLSSLAPSPHSVAQSPHSPHAQLNASPHAQLNASPHAQLNALPHTQPQTHSASSPQHLASLNAPLGAPHLASLGTSHLASLGISLGAPHPECIPEPPADLAGNTLRAANIWSEVIAYIGNGGRNVDRRAPWLSTSSYARLERIIDEFEARTPHIYRNNEANLVAHTLVGQGRLFGLFHSLLLCSRLVLYRDYLPFLPPLDFSASQGPVDGEPLYGASEPPTPDWWQQTFGKAVDAAQAITRLARALDQHGAHMTHVFGGFALVAASTLHLHLLYWPQSAPASTPSQTQYPPGPTAQSSQLSGQTGQFASQTGQFHGGFPAQTPHVNQNWGESEPRMWKDGTHTGSTTVHAPLVFPPAQGSSIATNSLEGGPDPFPSAPAQPAMGRPPQHRRTLDMSSGTRGTLEYIPGTPPVPGPTSVPDEMARRAEVARQAQAMLDDNIAILSKMKELYALAQTWVESVGKLKLLYFNLSHGVINVDASKVRQGVIRLLRTGDSDRDQSREREPKELRKRRRKTKNDTSTTASVAPTPTHSPPQLSELFNAPDLVLDMPPLDFEALVGSDLSALPGNGPLNDLDIWSGWSSFSRIGGDIEKGGNLYF